MGLVGGVVALNLVLLAVGYCVLAAFLPGRAGVRWLSYAGVALLTGAAVVGVALFLAAIAGTTTGPLALAVVAVLLAAAGASALLLRRGLAHEPEARTTGPGEWAWALAASAAFAVGVICTLGIVGGFRAVPWLDDAWGIWLPKGLALERLGLDPRLFAQNGHYVFFEVGDYPLWWSALLGLDVRFVGSVDLRAVDAQLGILAVGFLGSAARLLWGFVRPALLWPCLLLVAVSPDFWRHAQGGMADLPLAFYLSLYVLCALGWLATGAPRYAALAACFGAATLALKTEGLPELALALVVLSAVGLARAPRRLPVLWASSALAVLSFVPWLLWRSQHHVESRLPLARAFSPSYLSGRTDRLGPAAEAVARHLTNPAGWILLVPLALSLALAGAFRTRSAVWLAPLAGVALGFAFLLWVYEATQDQIDYLVGTSSYRVVDPIVLTAGVLVPVLAELLFAKVRTPVGKARPEPRASPRGATGWRPAR